MVTDYSTEKATAKSCNDMLEFYLGVYNAKIPLDKYIVKKNLNENMKILHWLLFLSQKLIYEQHTRLFLDGQTYSSGFGLVHSMVSLCSQSAFLTSMP